MPGPSPGRPTRRLRTQAVTITVDAAFAGASDLWAGKTVTVEGKTLTVTLPAKDAAVLSLL